MRIMNSQTPFLKQLVKEIYKSLKLFTNKESMESTKLLKIIHSNSSHFF